MYFVSDGKTNNLSCPAKSLTKPIDGRRNYIRIVQTRGVDKQNRATNNLIDRRKQKRSRKRATITGKQKKKIVLVSHSF
jgi:hypothetical protein